MENRLRSKIDGNLIIILLSQPRDSITNLIALLGRRSSSKLLKQDFFYTDRLNNK